MAKPTKTPPPSKPDTPKPNLGRRGRILACLAVFAITFVVFLPALNHQFVDWDDPDNFLENRNYRGLSPAHLTWMFTTFHMGHYQPLSWLSLGLDAVAGQTFFGDALDPRPYHFTNVVLHSINAVLVFLIAFRLLAGARPISEPSVIAPAHLAGAFAAALVFSVHPLRVESVAWATERRDLLSGVFFLLATLAYLRAPDSGPAQRWRWLLITLALFICSLLSKVMGVTLPVVLLVLDWYPLRRLPVQPWQWLTRRAWPVLAEKIPFFMLAAIFSAIASLGQGRHGWLVTLDMHPLLARIVQALYGLFFYLWKTVWPVELLPLYQLDFPMNVAEPRFVIGSLLGVLGLIAVIALLWLGRMKGLVAAALVYGVMLLPVLGLVQNGSQIAADRYSYLSCIGWAILVGGMVAQWARRPRGFATTAVLAATFIVIATLAVLTWRQTFVWRNTAALWTHIHRHDPSSLFGKNGYGFVLLQEGRIDEAIPLFEEVILRTPDNDQAHVNLWAALQRKGDVVALERAYERAKSVPALAVPAHYELGTLQLNRSDLPSAIANLAFAWKIDPRHLRAGTNLGLALHRSGQSAQAIEQFRAVLAVDDQFFHAHYNLALAYRAVGERSRALEHLRIAQRLNPNHAGVQRTLTELSGGGAQP